jgi:mono/diheme cytochrome c family protein
VTQVKFIKFGIALVYLLVLAGFVGRQTAVAADAENGKRIAQARCTRCHFVVGRSSIGAVAPTFAMIAVNHGSNAHVIASAILEAHQRKDDILSHEEADDVAAYIARIGR